MTINDARIRGRRRMVLKILTTEMTPETDPITFDDGIVSEALRVMEVRDSEWLLARARDRSYPFEGRLNLVDCMDEFRVELYNELRQENPDLEPLEVIGPTIVELDAKRRRG